MIKNLQGQMARRRRRPAPILARLTISATTRHSLLRHHRTAPGLLFSAWFLTPHTHFASLAHSKVYKQGSKAQR